MSSDNPQDTKNNAEDAPASLVEAAQLVLLDPKALQFSRVGTSLNLTIKEDVYEDVKILRAFPLSMPAYYLSVWDKDDVEIGIIADPALLEEPAQKLVDEHLKRRYHIPVITRIVGAKERFGTIDWEVETDRGTIKFTTKSLRENIQRPAPGRVIINDLDENRYDILDLENMDRQSQVLLFRYL